MALIEEISLFPGGRRTVVKVGPAPKPHGPSIPKQDWRDENTNGTWGVDHLPFLQKDRSPVLQKIWVQRQNRDVCPACGSDKIYPADWNCCDSDGGEYPIGTACANCSYDSLFIYALTYGKEW